MGNLNSELRPWAHKEKELAPCAGTILAVGCLLGGSPKGWPWRQLRLPVSCRFPTELQTRAMVRSPVASECPPFPSSPLFPGSRLLTLGSWLLGIPWAAVRRVANTFLVQTAFDPDEYWQGPEVAHRIVFG